MGPSIIKAELKRSGPVGAGDGKQHGEILWKSGGFWFERAGE
jgi:hypothetical protein